MVDIVLATNHGHVVIPGWVQDEESFDRWTASVDFPDEVQVSFEAGEVVVRVDELPRVVVSGPKKGADGCWRWPTPPHRGSPPPRR